MRTTLDIDNDVLEAAKALARQTRRTAGSVLSDLARDALTGSASKKKRASSSRTRGFNPFEKRGGVITNELINRLRERDAY